VLQLQPNLETLSKNCTDFDSAQKFFRFITVTLLTLKKQQRSM